MAALPKLVLTAVFITTPFLGPDGPFNVPDPEGLDAAVFTPESVPVSRLSVLDTPHVEPFALRQTQLLPTTVPPTDAGGTSGFSYRRRPVSPAESATRMTQQYAWFVEEKGPSLVGTWPATEPLTKRLSSRGGLRFSLPADGPALGAEPAASSFPAWRLMCFRRGA